MPKHTTTHPKVSLKSCPLAVMHFFAPHQSALVKQLCATYIYLGLRQFTMKYIHTAKNPPHWPVPEGQHRELQNGLVKFHR